MRGTWESKPVHSERNKRANGATAKQMGGSKRLKVSSLNSHLICVLCSGYYVEATTIVECLHTFCRSCIVKYLQSNSFCPICDVQIHQAKPWLSLRSDKTLQDLVYKLVPGLYQDEMKRRRQFYCRLEGDAEEVEGEDGGFLPQGARFFSQDDSISLSLEYYDGQGEEEEVEAKGKVEQTKERPKRYLQCPAAVTVRHLKKFLRMKYGIGVDCWVDIIYNDECLPEHFSLIDVAYTFAWRRTSPMRFSYRIFSKAAVRTVKPQRNLQRCQTEERDGKRSKNHSSLDQQKQSEYLGNFNLNPTNSGFCKSQSSSKTKGYSNGKSSGHSGERKEESCFRRYQEAEDGSKDKLSQSSEDSNASGLRIISEKEESSNGNSEDSKESFLGEKRRKGSAPVPNFGEETVDRFTAKKLLRNKQKWEERKKKGMEGKGERRRKSASQVEGEEETRRKCSVPKRRKTVCGEVDVDEEEEEEEEGEGEEEEGEGEGERGFRMDEEDMKSEALRKVFVTKEKPEVGAGKRKEGEVHRKKRKKSKHHEGEGKKRKMEVIQASPSIMSVAKDALKLKVKLNPGKPLVVPLVEEESRKKEEVEESLEKEGEKEGEVVCKKVLSDKERLLHLRAVRHKSINNKPVQKQYNTPPSLTISKIDSSDHHSLKPPPVVDTKPSLEIVLVSPNKNNNNNNNSISNNKSNSNKTIVNNINNIVNNSSKNSINNIINSNHNSNSSNGNNNSKTNNNNNNNSNINNNNNNSNHNNNNNINTNNNNNKSSVDNVNGKNNNNSSSTNNKNNNTNSNSNNHIQNNNHNINDSTNANTNASAKAKTEVNADPQTETEPKKPAETSPKEPRRPDVLDNFGVLDLSEKSTRTKENSSKGNSSPTKDPSEPGERSRKIPHQTILQIAQNLVNRKLSPVLPKNPLKHDSDPLPPTAPAPAPTPTPTAAMRNLKTLSDTAVNILMAAQNKPFAPPDPLKRPFSSISLPLPAPAPPPPPPTPPKDPDSSPALKIPVYPPSRDRLHPIPPVPNLHEIYPRGRGRPVPVIKPGQNQTVRQIPDPFMVLNRQGTQNPAKASSPPSKADAEEEAPLTRKLDALPALQAIKKATSLLKTDDKADAHSDADVKSLLGMKIINNNTKPVQNGSEGGAFGMKNGEERRGEERRGEERKAEERKGVIRLNCSSNSVRKIENMAKNIESVAAGLTARAVSNAMINAK